MKPICDQVAELLPLEVRAEWRDVLAKLEQRANLGEDTIEELNTKLAAATTERGRAIQDATSPLYDEIRSLRRTAERALADNARLLEQNTELQKRNSEYHDQVVTLKSRPAQAEVAS